MAHERLAAALKAALPRETVVEIEPTYSRVPLVEHGAIIAAADGAASAAAVVRITPQALSLEDFVSRFGPLIDRICHDLLPPTLSWITTYPNPTPGHDPQWVEPAVVGRARVGSALALNDSSTIGTRSMSPPKLFDLLTELCKKAQELVTDDAPPGSEALNRRTARIVQEFHVPWRNGSLITEECLFSIFQTLEKLTAELAELRGEVHRTEKAVGFKLT